MRRMMPPLPSPKLRDFPVEIVDNPEFHNSKEVSVQNARSHCRDAALLRKAVAGYGEPAI